MDSLFSVFLLFLAAIVALTTYLVVPRVPAAVLGIASAVALAAGVWWHWTQFAVEYRTSTWQEQLRYYASYVMVLLVILLSYGFYAFVAGGGTVSTVQEYAASAGSAIRNAGRKATSAVLGNTNTRSSNIVVGESVEVVPAASPAESFGAGISNLML